MAARSAALSRAVLRMTSAVAPPAKSPAGFIPSGRKLAISFSDRARFSFDQCCSPADAQKVTLRPTNEIGQCGSLFPVSGLCPLISQGPNERPLA